MPPDRVSPEITEAKTLLDQIKASGLGASEVFENVLSLFRGNPEHQPLDINAFVLEALALRAKA